MERYNYNPFAWSTNPFEAGYHRSGAGNRTESDRSGPSGTEHRADADRSEARRRSGPENRSGASRPEDRADAAHSEPRRPSGSENQPVRGAGFVSEADGSASAEHGSVESSAAEVACPNFSGTDVGKRSATDCAGAERGDGEAQRFGDRFCNCRQVECFEKSHC